jgi:hypothetical protein
VPEGARSQRAILEQRVSALWGSLFPRRPPALDWLGAACKRLKCDPLAEVRNLVADVSFAQIAAVPYDIKNGLRGGDGAPGEGWLRR